MKKSLQFKRSGLGIFRELLFLVIGLLVILFITGNRFYWMTDFLIFCILVLSYDLLYGYMGHLSFGHILYYGTGAYTTAMWIAYVNPAPLPAMLVGIVTAGLLSAIAGLVVIKTKGAAFALLNMAINELGVFVVHTVISEYTRGEDGLICSPGRIFGFIKLGKDINAMLFVFIIFIIIFVIMRLLTRSPYGIMVKSIKENETRVKFLGYNTARYKWVTFVIASTMAGVAGSLFALVQGFVSAGVISTFSNIEVIFAILIGGAGLLYGAVIGGIVFMLIKNYLPMLIVRVDDITAFRLPQWEMWLGIILLIIVFSFRKGIAGYLKDKSYLLDRLIKNNRESEEKNV